MTAEELFKAIKENYSDNLEKSTKVRAIIRKMERASCTTEDALKYAQEAGDILGRSFRQFLRESNLDGGVIGDDVAEVIFQALRNNYNTISPDITQIHNVLMDNVGLHVVPKSTPFNGTGANNLAKLVEETSQGKLGLPEALRILTEETTLLSQQIADETARNNAEFMERSGVDMKITRTASARACDWCREHAYGGKTFHSYSELPDMFFARHHNCDCVIDVVYANGNRSQAWAGGSGKRAWTRGEDGHWYKNSYESQLALTTANFRRTGDTRTVRRWKDVKTGMVRA